MPNKQRSCFIIRPMSVPEQLLALYDKDVKHFDHVSKYLFEEAIRQIGYTPISTPVMGANIIQAEIIENLVTADLVLCDMSTLNPNVFFELGIRTAVDMPMSVVRDNFTTAPFHMRPVSHYEYNASLETWTLKNEIQNLSEYLQKSVNSSGGRNTLWKYFGLKKRAELPPPASIEEKLDYIVKLFESDRDKRNVFLPEIVSPDKPFAKEREVINRAQLIAAKIEAEFTEIDITEGRVVLDLRGYVMDDSYRQQIVRLGEEHGVEVTIQGGAGSI